MSEIEAEVGANIRSIWTPTATNCFKRLNGGQLDVLYAGFWDLKLDDAAYKAFLKLRKGDKVAAMRCLFHDPGRQKVRKRPVMAL